MRNDVDIKPSNNGLFGIYQNSSFWKVFTHTLRIIDEVENKIVLKLF
jgi:hypothetical protein